MKEIVAIFLSLLICSCDKPADQNSSGIDAEPSQQTPPTEQPKEQAPKQEIQLPKANMQVAGKEIIVEIASTRYTRMKGYMGREEIPQGTGMIFIFSNSQPRSFIMDNCLVDIDIVFINKNGFIVSTAEMKMPSPGMASEFYPSIYPCKYALELPTGSIKKMKLTKNKRIIIPDEIKYHPVESD